MKKKLQTEFNARQYMLSKAFEIYYYKDQNLSQVEIHTHDYYEFFFFLEDDASIQIEKKTLALNYGDMVLIPPGLQHRAVIHSTKQPYRRFVFWISNEYAAQLMGQSYSYGYLIQLPHSVWE